MPCNTKEDDFCELLLHSFRNQVVENKELRMGLEVLGVALSLLAVDFCDSHLRKAMEWGEEATMVVGDKDDQGADGDGGLHPGEDVEAMGSHGGFQEGRIRT